MRQIRIKGRPYRFTVGQRVIRIWEPVPRRPKNRFRIISVPVEKFTQRVKKKAPHLTGPIRSIHVFLYVNCFLNKCCTGVIAEDGPDADFKRSINNWVMI